MKHDWKRDQRGDIIPADEDSEHPVAVCRRCGETSSCLHAQAPGTSCWNDYGPRLDADDCEGVIPWIGVEISVRHPGAAQLNADRTSISKRVEVPMTSFLDARLDLVAEALAETVEEVAAEWRTQRDRHRSDWITAWQQSKDPS
jgi:hypothetical protein